MPTRTSRSAGRRRWPRFFLDLDWFVASNGGSSRGRGLELTVRGARLPVDCRSCFAEDVVLHVSLPARERLFKARCTAQRADGRGWVLSFVEVAPDDLQLLGHTLIGEFGVLALPASPASVHRSPVFSGVSRG
jgi:hypothetical protein